MSKSLVKQLTQALAAMFVVSTSATAAEYSLEVISHPDAWYLTTTSIADDGTVLGSVGIDGNSCYKYLNGVFTILPMPSKAGCMGAEIDKHGNISLMIDDHRDHVRRVVEMSTDGNFQLLHGIGNWENEVHDSRGGRMAGQSGSRAYLFDRYGEGVNVGALTKKGYSWLNALNAKGQAVGCAKDRNNHLQAFSYLEGTLSWLPPLPGGGDACPHGINRNGEIVGIAFATKNDPYSGRAVLWRGGSEPVNLGTVDGAPRTTANAINSAGVIVGEYGGYTVDGGGKTVPGYFGMRVRDQVMVPLDSLVSADLTPLGGRLGTAHVINDKGVIAGVGSNGKTGYVLRPLP